MTFALKEQTIRIPLCFKVVENARFKGGVGQGDGGGGVLGVGAVGFGSGGIEILGSKAPYQGGLQ